MFDKLDEVLSLYEELERRMSDPDLVSDLNEYRRVHKQYADLTEVVTRYREYKETVKQIAETEEMLYGSLDDDMRDMAQMEFDELKEKRTEYEEILKVLLLPKDPNDDKDVILEVRAAAGGDEAALFAGELMRMYMRYAEKQGWTYEFLNTNETANAGYKEAIIEVHGQGAYSRLKFESGVHRVQRVPVTEASGRIHTSTATVAVLPEAEEVDVQIDPKDLRVDTFCSSGPGGQSVNTTYSAVRVTHLPTNLVVSQQDEKSQIKNRAKAMKVLRSRLYEIEMRKVQDAIAKERRGQVGSGDRSEKIRTYNFKENRITDHRIGFTMHQLAYALDGDLNELFAELESRDQAEK